MSTELRLRRDRERGVFTSAVASRSSCQYVYISWLALSTPYLSYYIAAHSLLTPPRA